MTSGASLPTVSQPRLDCTHTGASAAKGFKLKKTQLKCWASPVNDDDRRKSAWPTGTSDGFIQHVKTTSRHDGYE
jgi:hypothetical protein